MNQVVLGLSYGYHDASAALIKNGKILALAMEERLTRQKHDSFFPEFAIESCLKKAGVELKDIDCFAYYEKTEDKWSRVLSSSLKPWPFSLQEFKTSMKSWLGGKLWTEAQIANKLDVNDRPLLSFEHHLSHAAQAFIGSEFKDAAILTVDAVGEWETSTQYHAYWENGKPIFKKITADIYPHSLGLFYSAITAYLGFKPMSDECSTMALAAFGDDRYLEAMRSCIEINDEGKIKLDTGYFQFDRYFQQPYTEKFISQFGLPGKQKYSFKSYGEYNANQEELRLASIAFAAQKVYEECTLKLLSHLKKAIPSENLCLAGGGALNCVTNQRVLSESGFINLYIPRDPGDGGASLGAAFLADYATNSSDIIPSDYEVSLGDSYSSEPIEEMLPFVKPHKMQKYKKIGLEQNKNERWKQHKFLDSVDMINFVAKKIAEGKIVGWTQQGCEHGPRALGYRSILFRSDSEELAKVVSTKVKDRANFRPYAISMTNKFAEDALVTSHLNQIPMKYMQLAVPVHADFLQQLKMGLHIDQTTRPQIVTENDNELYFRLLQEYGKISGVEAFINTSFNESGYPMAESPAEALLMFARTDMDILVINNLVITKEYLDVK